jgi:hypothetical protein
VAWRFPALGGSVQHSLSPIVADRGAVMKPAYASEFGSPWSILLSRQNFTNCDRVSTGWTGTIAVYEACLCTAGHASGNDGLSIPRAEAGFLRANPTSKNRPSF